MTSDPITTIMTEDPTTIERSEPISEAYRLLQRAPFHHLVVVEGDQVVGVLATTDILRLVYDIDGSDDRALRTYIDHQFSIDDAMTVELRTLTLDATIHGRRLAALGGVVSLHRRARRRQEPRRHHHHHRPRPLRARSLAGKRPSEVLGGLGDPLVAPRSGLDAVERGGVA